MASHIKKINIIKVAEDKIKMKEEETIMLVKVLSSNIMEEEEVEDQVNMEVVVIVDHIILILHKDSNLDLQYFFFF